MKELAVKENGTQTSTKEEGRFITNGEFIKDVFREIPSGAHIGVCTKSGDPTEGGWSAQQADNAGPLTDSLNNYINCSTFRLSDEGAFTVRKGQFAGFHVLLLDDLGTKVPMGKLGEFKLSWLIETSPGNFQGGIILAEPITDIKHAEQLQSALLESELCDKGASGVSRWMRLPEAINGKDKYRVDGRPFQCRLVEWHPECRYTVEEIVTGLGLVMAKDKPKTIRVDELDDPRDDVFQPQSEENPVLSELKKRGLYKTPLGSGKHDVTCPWVDEHTDGIDSGAAYFEPDDQYPVGGFVCLHSHREKYKTKEFLKFLGIDHVQAMNKPVIKVVQGELHRVVDSAERELANRGRHFQAGGLIVTVNTNPATGDPAIVPINKQTLVKELSAAANWLHFDKRSKDWLRCDPPSRHVGVICDAGTYQYLPQLAGLARQPYFRESDGVLVMHPGYDKEAKLFSVFDPRQYEIPEPTHEEARLALDLLKGLLSEFRFVAETDKAAALSAMFTAVVRPSLPHAPAFHVRAPVSGSGKSYLSELIGAFAGPATNAKVSYPKNSEEVSKVILSLLLTNPAVIEFDDMDCDWLPHGVINRALTAEHITDRILGVSKTATVSTRSLFLGSGNNVGPVRDLQRRVLTINIDPRCDTPATREYVHKPVQLVRQQRGKYVTAVLTVIQAWKNAGSPPGNIESIVTYGGAWTDYCRHPLMWLGLPDPATPLLNQVKHDPDSEALGELLRLWYQEFGSSPTTVRKALEFAEKNDQLMEAFKEFPVEEKGVINRSKVGWLIKKNENRIVGGLRFEKSTADGRTAWRVVQVD